MKEAGLGVRISCTVMHYSRALADPIVTSQAEMVLPVCSKLMQLEAISVLSH